MKREQVLRQATGGDACPLSDDEVVERVKAGETALFEVLMRRYNQRVYRVARAILGDDLEAEDVMQDAYVRAYAHLDQFERRASFATWLTRIALHEALARVRRSRRFEVLEPEVEPPDAAEASPAPQHRDPERRLFDTQMKEFLEAAICSLSRDYRTVFMLREVEGLSTAETAESLGVSEEVVRTRLHRARALLRDDLYARAGASSAGAFQFGASRCDRMVEAVLRRIAPTAPPR